MQREQTGALPTLLLRPHLSSCLLSGFRSSDPDLVPSALRSLTLKPKSVPCSEGKSQPQHIPGRSLSTTQGLFCWMPFSLAAALPGERELNENTLGQGSHHLPAATDTLGGGGLTDFLKQVGPEGRASHRSKKGPKSGRKTWFSPLYQSKHSGGKPR